MSKSATPNFTSLYYFKMPAESQSHYKSWLPHGQTKCGIIINSVNNLWEVQNPLGYILLSHLLENL